MKRRTEDMNFRIDEKKKVLLLFILGIGCPSLILGYLAYRGVQNDRALLEQKRGEKITSAADRIAGALRERFSQTEEAFLEAVRDSSGKELKDIWPLLESIRSRNPLVAQVFVLRETGTIFYPPGALLFDPGINGDSPPPLPKNETWESIPAEALRLEYQSDEYGKAIALYEKALTRITSKQRRGEVLNAVARLQKKAGRIEAAVDTFRILTSEYDGVEVAGGIPLGLAARIELGDIHLSRKNPTQAADVWLEAYGSLLEDRWKLKKAPYSFLSQILREKMESLLSDDQSGNGIAGFLPRFSELIDAENKRRKETESLLAFQEWGARELAALAGSWKEKPPVSQRHSLRIGGKYVPVALLGPLLLPGPPRCLGILYDVEDMTRHVLNTLLKDALETEKAGWIVRDGSGEILLTSNLDGSESLITRTGFADHFPEWGLELYREESPWLSALFISQNGLYFYIFLLIGGILVFGLVLTMRIINREMDLAGMKSDFVSTVSHEFKSPLTSIRQLSEMLQAGRIPSEERRRKYYDVLVEQSDRLSLLVENILNLSKMEKGLQRFFPKKTDIAVLLRDIVTSVQSRVRHDNFELSLEIADDLPPVEVDREAFIQAVSNLIDNAVKYSEAARTIEVQARLRDRKNAAVSVRDYGCGITDEDREHLFERFYRGEESVARRIRGTGLGLALVKQIMESHRGGVEVRSEPGKGSLFTLVFPISQTEKKNHGKNSRDRR